MSSTNVHSEQEINNIYCASAQIIPTEKEVEIPPQTAKKGLSSFEIMSGEGIEISVEESSLRKDGKLVSKAGTVLGNPGKEAYEALVSKHKNKNKEDKEDKDLGI